MGKYIYQNERMNQRYMCDSVHLTSNMIKMQTAIKMRNAKTI